MSHASIDAVRDAWAAKTMPPGALGCLEEVALLLARVQQTARPGATRAHVVLFAADHGVARRGVSAYPREVTAQMVRNFAAGGAAVNVLARLHRASLDVVDVGVDADLSDLDGVVAAKVARGSHDLAERAALEPPWRGVAIDAGRAAVARAGSIDVLLPGEMGIGNTTSAAALAAALLGLDARACVGRGTGIDDATLSRKRDAVERALSRIGGATDPDRLLDELGGLEIAALVGAIDEAARSGIAVLVDGFIVGTAALVAVRRRPAVRDALLFAHRSAETGHGQVLAALDARPLLDLDLRLGEASGALLALPLLRAACAILDEMATFASASVADRQ